MKKIFLLLTGMTCLGMLRAQVKEGTITYERKINLHRSIKDEQAKAMMPEFRTINYVLSFNDNTSMYKVVPDDERPDPFAGSGSGPRLVLNVSPAGAGDLYSNFEQARTVKTAELAGKNYLIVDTIRKMPWKLGTETKKILGYTCTKATRTMVSQTGTAKTIVFGGTPAKDNDNKPQSREIEVVAWFTPDIPSPVGPENFVQLPGAVLQVDIDNGGTIITATDIKKTVDQKELKEPKKGKIISSEEYNKMISDMLMSQLPPGTNLRRMN